MNGSATHVLLLESLEEERRSITEVLCGDGYAVQAVPSGVEALRLLEEDDIHIVLLSTGIPDLDGYDFIRRIRTSHLQGPVQILLISADHGPEELQKAIDAGADDFISRPFDGLELSARVKAAEMRWESQANLLREREFFRVAVAEEERLSSLVLDQNRNLKEAYEKIRRLNEELEKANKDLELIASYDGLSGLLNRRSLFHKIGVEVERSMRIGVPLTGLMIDIDHFKGINDNYGHPCGDMVLKEITGRLSKGLRKYDYAGRYGGEEFFVLLSNSNEHQAMGISERFRRDIADTRFQWNQDSFHVTVSVGVARYRIGESQETWIERADRAMYQAKQNGRNRVVQAP